MQRKKRKDMLRRLRVEGREWRLKLDARWLIYRKGTQKEPKEEVR